MLRSALAYLSLAWAVLPLKPGGKTPLTEHGVKDASADPDEVRAWWARWPTANLGIAVGQAWLVVDVDVRNDGLRTVDAWPELPLTPRQVTASGGTHTLLTRPQGAIRGKAGQGVDILASGRYFVAAPSQIDGVRYRWTTGPRVSNGRTGWHLRKLAPCPGWLADLIQVPEAAPTQVQAPSNAYDRACAYVARIGPAISGQGGSAHTFHVACAMVRGFALSIDEALAAMQEWNTTCDPPWSERELRHKLASALSRGKDPMGHLLVRQA